MKEKLNSTDVIDALTDLFIVREIPAYIRSNDDREFFAEAVREWIKAIGSETVYIEPGSPRENEYCESFNARLKEELFNGEIFYTLREAKIVNEQWRPHYNTKRPHSALGYRPPAPESNIPIETRRVMHQVSNRTERGGKSGGRAPAKAYWQNIEPNQPDQQARRVA